MSTARLDLGARLAPSVAQASARLRCDEFGADFPYLIGTDTPVTTNPESSAYSGRRVIPRPARRICQCGVSRTLCQMYRPVGRFGSAWEVSMVANFQTRWPGIFAYYSLEN